MDGIEIDLWTASRRRQAEALPGVGRRFGLFATAREVTVARAPARLDVMGGIADYSGATVLQWPLADAAWVAVAPSAAPRLRIVSLPTPGADGAARTVELPAGPAGDAIRGGPRAFGEWLRSGDVGWCGYVLGPLAVWAATDAVVRTAGLDVLVASEIPIGAGIASSAALTVASATALADLYGVAREPIPLALDCQQVENQVVGAPCGAMDPTVSACGRADRLLRIECQPAAVTGEVALPSGWAIAGVDSGVRHTVAGDAYRTVRAAAFMGWQMLAELDGAPLVADASGVPRVRHPAWGSWLANVDADAWRTRAARLPIEARGAEFLARHGRLIDPATEVDADRAYPVRAATAHPILENQRIREFETLLPHLDQPTVAERCGRLMFASHASYTICGLGSRATDRIVDAVRSAGPARGFHGAKITGGGSGGTVAVLLKESALDDLHRLAADLAGPDAPPLAVFHGSSDGAAALGALRVG